MNQSTIHNPQSQRVDLRSSTSRVVDRRESSTEILIIGVGNEFRGDDAAGLHVARRLKKLRIDNIRVVEESGEGAQLIESWKGATTVFIVDAVSSDSKPGTIHRFDVAVQRIPSDFFHYSSHAFSVAEAIELARSLAQLPEHLIVYGIEGAIFSAGVGLSAEVELAIEEVVDRIRQEDRLRPDN